MNNRTPTIASDALAPRNDNAVRDAFGQAAHISSFRYATRTGPGRMRLSAHRSLSVPADKGAVRYWVIDYRR